MVAAVGPTPACTCRPRWHLAIPHDQVSVSGMSLGYADESAIENTLVSEREDLARVATLRGFRDTS